MVPWFSKKKVDAPKVDDAPAMDDEAPAVAGACHLCVGRHLFVVWLRQ
jgi:hypothetical protein